MPVPAQYSSRAGCPDGSDNPDTARNPARRRCCNPPLSAAAGCSNLRAAGRTAPAHSVPGRSAGPAAIPAHRRRWCRCPVPDCTGWGWPRSAHRSAAGRPVVPHWPHSWSRSRRSGLPPVQRHRHWRCGRSGCTAGRTAGTAGPAYSCKQNSPVPADGPAPH